MDYTEEENDNNASNAQNFSSSQATEEQLQEKHTNSNFSDIEDLEAICMISSSKRQNSNLSNNVARKKQRTADERHQDSTELNSYMEWILSSHSFNESTKLDDRDILSTGLTVRDEWSFSELTKPKLVVPLTESEEKGSISPIDYMEEENGNNASDAHNISYQASEEQSKEKQTNSNFPVTKDQEPICMISSSKRQNSNFSDKIADEGGRQESVEANSYIELMVTSHSLNEPTTPEDSEILWTGPTVRGEWSFSELTKPNLEISSSKSEEKDREISFDLLQHTLPREFFKQVTEKKGNLSSEIHPNENQISSNSDSILISSNSSENMEIVPIVVILYALIASKKLNIHLEETKIILNLEVSSPELSHKIDSIFDIKQEDAVEINSRTGTQSDNDQHCKLDQNKKIIYLSVYDKQMENVFNEVEYHKKEMTECALSLCSTDKTHDLDETIFSAVVLEKNNSSFFHKDTQKLENETSAKYEYSLFKPLEEMVGGEPSKSITYCEEKSSNNCEELLIAPILVGQNCEEFLSKGENKMCEENNEKSATFLIEIEDVSFDSNKDPDIFPRK